MCKDRKKEKNMREAGVNEKKKRKKSGNKVIALIIYLADVVKGVVRSSRVKGERGRASRGMKKGYIFFSLTFELAFSVLAHSSPP